MTTENNKTIAIPEDLTEFDLILCMANVRKQLKQWQAKHKGSRLGKNLAYGIKAAVNMATAGEDLGDNISSIIVEKCVDG